MNTIETETLSLFQNMTMDEAMGIGVAKVDHVYNFAYHIQTGVVFIDWVLNRSHQDWFNDKDFFYYHQQQLEKTPNLDWAEEYATLNIEKIAVWGRFGNLTIDETDLKAFCKVDVEDGYHDLINGVPFVCVWAIGDSKRSLDSMAQTLLKRGIPPTSIVYPAYNSTEFTFEPFYIKESHKSIKPKEKQEYQDRWKYTIGDGKEKKLELGRKKALLKYRLREVSDIISSTFNIGAQLTESKLAVSDRYFSDPEFISWAESHGVELVPGKVPYFREGGTARAYFIDNLVIKITNNRVEANVAYLAKQQKNTNTVAMDIKKLDGGYYAILMPAVDMQNVDKQYKKASDYLTLLIDDDDFNGFPSDVAVQSKICDDIIKDNRLEESLKPYMMDMLKILRKLYDDTGFIHTDATPTNIGMYKGEVVIPDLGPNQPGNYDPDRELDRLQSNRRALGLPDEPLI